jgi:hypothetical protein
MTGEMLSGKRVTWRGLVYWTGNSRCGEVELYREGKFVRVVKIKYLK